MTYDGWLSFGGNEVANDPRALGYSMTSPCRGWLRGEHACSTLVDALEDVPYVYANISQAPWYDPTLPEVSSRFYGVTILELTGLLDSTRTAQVTENAGDGGTIGLSRRGTRSTRVRAFLLAEGADAMEYGRAWLDAALSPGACGQHGTQCGVTDLEFFSTCPPSPDDFATEDAYFAAVDELRRYLHDVAVTSGPFTISEQESRGVIGQEVEWTFTSERPWVYGKTQDVALPSVASSVVTDIPLNLAKYPSAELSSGTVLLGTNYSENPSLETVSTLWGVDQVLISGSSAGPYLTGGTSSEKAGSGTFSYRGRILGNGSTEVASSRSWLYINHTISLPAYVAGRRFSAGAWAAIAIAAGAAVSVINKVEVRIQFLNSTPAIVGDVLVGTLDPAAYANGEFLSLSKIVPPASAVTARLQIRADVTWRSSATPANNSDIRLYADMATLTAP